MLSPETFRRHFDAMAAHFGVVPAPDTPQIFFEYLCEYTSDESFAAACQRARCELGAMPTPKMVREYAAAIAVRRRDEQAAAEYCLPASQRQALPAVAVAPAGDPSAPCHPGHPGYLVPRSAISKGHYRDSLGQMREKWVMPFLVESAADLRREWANLDHYALVPPTQVRLAKAILARISAVGGV